MTSWVSKKIPQLSVSTECDAGVFGDNCDQVCHCYGEECKGGQACKYGCEQGWMGPYCCTREYYSGQSRTQSCMNLWFVSLRKALI